MSLIKGPTLEIDKQETVYEVRSGKLKISATKKKDGSISLRNFKGGEDFIFTNSTPEMVANMGKLIQEASKLKL